MKTLHDIQRTNQIRQQAQQNQQKEALARALAANSHTMFVMNEAEFFELVVNIKLQQGLNEQQILSWLETLSQESSGLKALWQRRGEGLKSLISFAPSVVDSAALAVLAKDLGKSGNILTKYQIKNYHGRTYVIIKGYPSLRQHLTGTRYLASHPKVVSMGIGKMDAAKAIKGGFVLSIVLSVGFHAVDQLLNDQKTWHDFVGGVAADVIYAGAASAIAYSAVSIVVGGVATFTIGPLALVVLVGVGLALAFGILDKNIMLGETLATLLKQESAKLERSLNNSRHAADKLSNQYSEDMMGFLHRFFAIPRLERY